MSFSNARTAYLGNSVTTASPARLLVMLVDSMIPEAASKAGRAGGLVAGERSEILFTNFDTDLHNVAIYRTSDVTDPIFIGSEFSGSESGVIEAAIARGSTVGRSPCTFTITSSSSAYARRWGGTCCTLARSKSPRRTAK